MSDYRARPHVWLLAGEPLACPGGHKLRHNAALLQHEAFVCQHVEPRELGECGKRCYVLVVPGGLRYVAEVTVPEMLHMRDARLDVAGVLGFLR